MTIRRLLGKALIVALVIAGVTAMVALAQGSFDDTDARVIGTSVGFGLCSALAASGSALLARGALLRAVGIATGVLATATFVVLLSAIWVGEDEDALWRAFGVAGFATLAASHASLVLRGSSARDTATVAVLVAASISLAVLDAGIGMAGVSGLLDDLDDEDARWIGVLVVAMLLCTALPPVMRRTAGVKRSAAPPVVEIKARRNGPLKVTGPIRLIDADGNEYDIPEGEPVALCRCGQSRTKPFCDKSHAVAGFRAEESAR